ncbi:hypothetical protein [Streptomyces sp. RLB3-6]|uniref:hypothetical protein n=1 Tax=Streptomyces sp. RLB3-6 TaxID=2594457 RepID=UPI0011642226|nr:hypothetical protein [Streptomyces sp. RLB3-6]QDN84374.1 hypothetical protein FNV61_00155 [Streptomyces sp. RLB3-6]
MTSKAPQAPAYRVELGKRPAEYLVIVDDEGNRYPLAADFFLQDFAAVREVRYVERLADHPEGRRAQWNELHGDCEDSKSPLGLLTYTAVSHGHAAHLALRDFAMASAAASMAYEIDVHLGFGASGWIAIRIADGGSDGDLYADATAARAAQKQPERCTYFPISPLCPWSVRQCEEHLKFEADRLSGRLARELGTSR